ncbi:hypothetical protein AAFF_G00424260 [Aldrovandia affinis]|uniref:Uncharacterized protein n=1 Tax=Aldrovandia affinis TaxID=143900 RepID=A0AAD7T888_9TELE|nr:hypothetical protein AAFF_G00424260 [Aldrovandia affinis]
MNNLPQSTATDLCCRWPQESLINRGWVGLVVKDTFAAVPVCASHAFVYLCCVLCLRGGRVTSHQGLPELSVTVGRALSPSTLHCSVPLTHGCHAASWGDGVDVINMYPYPTPPSPSLSPPHAP